MKLKNRYIALIACSILIPLTVSARICTSVASGNWTAATTWSCDAAPAAGDTLNIVSGHTVSITSNLSYSTTAMRVNVFGTWSFVGGGSKIAMPCGSMVFIASGGTVQGNGSGSSQTIKICNNTYWSASDGPENGPSGWPATVLPVELVGVDAYVVDSDVRILWSTASERDASHYVIERSQDVESWDDVGSVPAVGSSSQLRSYQFVDLGVGSGTWYYRLVQFDVDGSNTTSRVVPVQVHANGDVASCSPSILSPSVTDLIVHRSTEDPNAFLLREAASGRAYPFSVPVVEEGRAQLHLPTLPDGMYILQSQGTGAKVCRFVVQN